MRISIDERDITNILELEQYFKERQYIINWQEFEIITKLARSLNPIDIQYHKIYEKNYFIVVFIYRGELYDKFYCWTKVEKNREQKPRHRHMTKNIEEVNTLSSLYYYLSERARLINSHEFTLIAQKLANWNTNISYRDCRMNKATWVNIVDEKKGTFIPTGIDAFNQIAAHYYMDFEQFGKKIEIDTYVMAYNQFARERRRDNV